jgi:hypothetical protein
MLGIKRARRVRPPIDRTLRQTAPRRYNFALERGQPFLREVRMNRRKFTLRIGVLAATPNEFQEKSKSSSEE